MEFLNSIKDKEETIILGHIEVNGVKYDNGVINKRGLKQSVFKKFKKVILGHIHLSQELGNIVYPGSLMEHTFQDNKGFKGFSRIQ